MNNKKTSNPVRLIAFFLATVILVCTFGFTVDGWQLKDDDFSSQDGDVQSPSEDMNFPGEDDTILPDDVEVVRPEFTNPLTGVECEEELAKKYPIAFVMNGSNGLYGICESDIMIDIPVEDDNYKILAFYTNIQNLWKIGNLSATRGYISNLVKYFSGIEFAVGCDDRISYDCCNLLGKNVNLNQNIEYRYTEQDYLYYTNKDLINNALHNLSVNNDVASPIIIPYDFIGYNETIPPGECIALNITVNYSSNHRIEFAFNEENQKYVVKKDDAFLIDMLNGKTPEYKNCFILFADSVTYDTLDYSQMILNTTGNGIGYYVTDGFVYEIRWTASIDGYMSFYSLDGEKLVVNRGNTYIFYAKSSVKNDLVFE